MTFHSAIKSNALVYQCVEKILQGATEPLSIIQIYQSAGIREVTDKEYTVADAVGSLYKRGKLRRLPYSGVGKSRYAYEWAHRPVTGPAPVAEVQPVEELVSEKAVTENKLPSGRKFQEDKPEITVTANGVTIVTSKIKITVEL